MLIFLYNKLKKNDFFTLNLNSTFIMASKRIMLEYKELLKDPNCLFSIEINSDSLFQWNFFIFGPEDTLYEGGIFPGKIIFPKDYPNSPPQVKFDIDMKHPNIYRNGNVCISILHSGSDQYGYENDNERWSPTQGVNSIMLSIISLLSAPNFESPANVDMSTLQKNNYEEYKKMIFSLVSITQN